jgi:anti-sigma regulatory factor (Ser/Thr protein kinase)
MTPAQHAEPPTYPDTDTLYEAVAAQAAGHRACISLPGARLAAPSDARRILRSVLAAWQIPATESEDAELIVSELATNAVVHTAGATISLLISLTEGKLALSVVDRGPHRPIRPHQADIDAESGRGLHLIGALTEDWGAAPLGGGSCVWARLAVPVPLNAL